MCSPSCDRCDETNKQKKTKKKKKDAHEMKLLLIKCERCRELKTILGDTVDERRKKNLYHEFIIKNRASFHLSGFIQVHVFRQHGIAVHPRRRSRIYRIMKTLIASKQGGTTIRSPDGSEGKLYFHGPARETTSWRTFT